MEKIEQMRLSETVLGERTIIFERRQLELYTKLAKENPENEYFKRTKLELAEQLHEDEQRLKAANEKSL